jgi:16S rRNA (cytidine1402-2'-O)-methyltransferase
MYTATRKPGKDSPVRETALSRGYLYVVGTPIGNLGDICLRAAEVLKGVSHVAAEDTRRTRKLLSHLGARARLFSCHEHNEMKCSQRVIGYLTSGEDVALVTDAGTPGLSDPGAKLVEAVRDAGLPVVPVPGVSAITAALSVAAMPGNSFLFGGFLPAKRSARCRVLQELAEIPYTIVLFEAPHRLEEGLRDILDVLGDRKMVVARELTKVHETVLAGSVSDLLETMSAESVKGEITLVISGACPVDSDDFSGNEGLLRELASVMTSTKQMSARESVDLIVRLTGFPRSRVYDLVIKTAGT